MGYQSKRKRRRRKRRRHDEELVPSHLRMKDPVDQVQNAFKNPTLMNNPDTILAMQSVMGNEAVQRVLQRNASEMEQTEENSAPEGSTVEEEKAKREELIDKERTLRLERYKSMSLMLDAVFPEDKMLPMMQMYKEIGFDPEKELLVEIQNGKYPEYLPVGPSSVFTLSEEEAEKTGQIYFLSDDVKHDLLRLQMILMMVVPEDTDLIQIMQNPVVMVNDITNSILGVTGLENSTELEGVAGKLDMRLEEYPALARFLTEEQAKLMMDIEPETFGIMLEDMLPPDQVEEIMRSLRVFIKQLKVMVIKGHVLKRPRWEEARRRGMFNKDSSSFDQVIMTLNNLPR